MLLDEGLDLVADVNNGAAPSLLIPLMQSSEPDIQANSLKILAVCVNKGMLIFHHVVALTILRYRALS